MTPAWRLSRAVLLLVVALSVACTAPPEKELHQAEGALESARAAGAPRYAPDEFGAAEAAMTRANAAVTDRDYKQALNFALDARERALVAVRSATEARARVRGELEHRIADLDVAVKALDARLAEAETARVARAALTSGRTASTRVAKALAGVRPLLDQGDDDKAAAALEPLAAQVTKARSEIDAAIEARNSRRPVRRPRR